MAEGGPRPDPSSMVGTQPNNHLECPICLEQLRQPKLLPCLHTFCEECLSLYITKETSEESGTVTSFTCPVCRKLTHPVDKSQEKENWARQFPTDSHAAERIKFANQTTEQHFCKPCQKKENVTPAEFWCQSNKSLFCKTCKEDYHDMVHSDCDIINITESDRFQLGQDQSIRRCDKHKSQIDCYCEDHKYLGCSKCIHVDHRMCEDVSTAEEYIQKLESSSLLQQKRESIQQGVGALGALIKDFYLHIQRVSDDKDAVLKSLDDLQEQINRRVEELKKEVTEELVSKYKEEHENLKVSTQKCERLKAAMENTLSSSATALQNKDHVSTILLIQKGQAELESCKDLMIEMTTFSTEFNSDVSRQIPTLSLGKVVVRKQPRNVLSDFKAFQRPFSKRGLKLVRKVCIRCPSDFFDCSVYGLVCFPDGRIVVGDYQNKKIKLIDKMGDVIDELKVNSSPWDLCMVDNTIVTAAVDSPGGIRVVTVTSSKLTLSSTINTEHGCYGIAYRNGRFVVGSRSGVYSLTENGSTHKVLVQGSNEMMFGVSHDPHRKQLYITRHTATPGSTAVSRLSDDNKKTDILQSGVVKRAVGVDVDMEGNVYVCGQGSTNVGQTSGNC